MSYKSVAWFWYNRNIDFFLFYISANGLPHGQIWVTFKKTVSYFKHFVLYDFDPKLTGSLATRLGFALQMRWLVSTWSAKLGWNGLNHLATTLRWITQIIPLDTSLNYTLSDLFPNLVNLVFSCKFHGNWFSQNRPKLTKIVKFISSEI